MAGISVSMVVLDDGTIWPIPPEIKAIVIEQRPGY